MSRRASGGLARGRRNVGMPRVDHTWMWRLNPHHGAVKDSDEYVDSMRAAPGIANPCLVQPARPLDTGAAHATCCAVGEATRGHNVVTALVHAAAQSCDCTAEIEVPGIIHCPRHLDLLPARSAGRLRLHADQT